MGMGRRHIKGIKIEAGQVHGAFMAALSARYAKVISVDECIDLIAHNVIGLENK